MAREVRPVSISSDGLISGLLIRPGQKRNHDDRCDDEDQADRHEEGRGVVFQQLPDEKGGEGIGNGTDPARPPEIDRDARIDELDDLRVEQPRQAVEKAAGKTENGHHRISGIGSRARTATSPSIRK